MNFVFFKLKKMSFKVENFKLQIWHRFMVVKINVGLIGNNITTKSGQNLASLRNSP